MTTEKFIIVLGSFIIIFSWFIIGSAYERQDLKAANYGLAGVFVGFLILASQVVK